MNDGVGLMEEKFKSYWSPLVPAAVTLELSVEIKLLDKEKRTIVQHVLNECAK